MCTLKAYLSIALRFEKNLNLILTLVKRTLKLKFGILHSEEEVIMILTIFESAQLEVIDLIETRSGWA